jgi:hypothetical protein
MGSVSYLNSRELGYPLHLPFESLKSQSVKHYLKIDTQRAV